MLRKGSHKRAEFHDGRHRFEHWYRDNSLYFITARCRGQTAAFETEECKDVFWDRLTHYMPLFGFVPVIVSLLDNHYHLIGHLKVGTNLGPMMQRVHGSVAKLVNDARGTKLTPFWTDAGHQNYFDGCLRDPLQFRRAYRYTLTQYARHAICELPEQYPHTRVYVDVDRAAKRALEIKAFLAEVPYHRYDRRAGRPRR